MNKKMEMLTTLLVLGCTLVKAQFSLTGTVKDKLCAEPLAGASVVIEKTFIALQTNSNGGFEVRCCGSICKTAWFILRWRTGIHSSRPNKSCGTVKENHTPNEDLPT